MNHLSIRFGAVLAMFGSFAIAAPVAVIAQPGSTAKVPQIKFTDYKLANGLRVILSVDHSAPVVAVSVTYNVGSRNEHPGRTGFAHLFEHMMFQGSANVGKGEHMLLIQDNGGSMNGTTNQDRTNYFETLPSNQLDLALFLEADRMGSLDISQANLDNQRAVVQEEKRQSYDNQPYGQTAENMESMAFTSFAYKHTTIGSMDDLNAANLADVISFHKIYYAPNNACIAVVGDFNEGVAKRKIEKFFGSIPRQADPPAPDTTELPIVGEKRKVLSDPLARLTEIEIAYKTVSGADPDSYPLQILGSILSAGRTGRLYNAITDKRLALQARAGGQMGRGPGLFSFTARIPPDGKVATVEKAWDTEIARIQTDGVSEDEVRRALTQARAAALVGGAGGRGGRGGGLQTVLGRANALTQDAIFYNDPNRVNTQLINIEKVTAEDVKRVAIKYFSPKSRVVLITNPDQDQDSQFEAAPIENFGKAGN